MNDTVNQIKPTIFNNEDGIFKQETVIYYTTEGKGKQITIISLIDRIGKIDSHFEVSNINGKSNLLKTSFLDNAIEYYNNLEI